MKKSQIVLVAVFLFFAVLAGNELYAQGPGFDDDVQDTVPLDGGLSLLAAAGIAYGAKKLKGGVWKNDLTEKTGK